VENQVAPILTATDQIRAAVVPPEPFTFTLTGRSGDIEIRLSNSSTDPLRVTMSLSSPKLRFPEGDVDVLLRPNGVTTVTIPVEARANGTSAVDVTLSTPAGQQLGDTVTLTSRVNSLTGFGQVLTGGLIIVLLTWWFSHWRSKRRGSPGSSDPPSGADDVSDEPTVNSPDGSPASLPTP
jgi:hypothetical protein